MRMIQWWIRLSYLQGKKCLLPLTMLSLNKVQRFLDLGCRLLMILFNVFYVFVFVFISKIYLKEMNKKCYLLSMRFPLLLLMTCLCEVPASFLFFRHCQDGSRTTSTIMGNKNKQWLQTLWILSYTFPKKVSICLIYLISVQTIIWNYPCFFFSWPRDKKLNT